MSQLAVQYYMYRLNKKQQKKQMLQKNWLDQKRHNERQKLLVEQEKSRLETSGQVIAATKASAAIQKNTIAEISELNHQIANITTALNLSATKKMHDSIANYQLAMYENFLIEAISLPRRNELGSLIFDYLIDVGDISLPYKQFIEGLGSKKYMVFNAYVLRRFFPNEPINGFDGRMHPYTFLSFLKVIHDCFTRHALTTNEKLAVVQFLANDDPTESSLNVVMAIISANVHPLQIELEGDKAFVRTFEAQFALSKVLAFLEQSRSSQGIEMISSCINDAIVDNSTIQLNTAYRNQYSEEAHAALNKLINEFGIVTP